MPERIFLFDLDGVIIQPDGYRAAVRATLDYFAGRLGVGRQILDEETISIFEAQGITSEWDMVPLSLVILLDRIAGQNAGFSAWATLDDAIREASRAALQLSHVDYAGTIRKLSAYLRPPMAPSDAILENINHLGSQALFPHLKHPGFLVDLLGRTRDLRGCATSSVFQNYILGDRLYAETYGASPIFKTESYLARYDRVLISPEWRARLQQELAGGRLKMAAITARPSLPPVSLADVAHGYSPEAEQALTQSGFSGIPFMGYGSVVYLGDHLGLSGDLLLKPSPVQALAALLAALGEQPWPALVEAARLAGVASPALRMEPVQLNGCHFEPGSEYSVHIIEDSPIGIQATQAAVAILKQKGVAIRLSAWGITQNIDKQAALVRLGARVFPDVNQALTVIFQDS